MLNKLLHRLFATEQEPFVDDGGKITLGDVLARGWMELWYQPKIELKTKRMVGAEALVRARHPTRGVLPPGVFLGGANESDMMALTERVIVTALRDYKTWADAGIALKVAVNVPVSALMSLPIADIMSRERPEAANWPGLVLEVTEDEIINDIDRANEIADALREYHCTFALDDFGAGYSSLVRLRQLPFSELKIDRSYVINCHTDKFNAGLCETIIELGHRFGLKTVAEGIESMHEAHKLQALGADVGQGYLFAKPMSKAALAGIVRKRLGARPAA